MVSNYFFNVYNNQVQYLIIIIDTSTLANDYPNYVFYGQVLYLSPYFNGNYGLNINT
jgi:hypothetical protein